jgi:hypothetical protein
LIIVFGSDDNFAVEDPQPLDNPASILERKDMHILGKNLDLDL